MSVFICLLSTLLDQSELCRTQNDHHEEVGLYENRVSLVSLMNHACLIEWPFGRSPFSDSSKYCIEVIVFNQLCFGRKTTKFEFTVWQVAHLCCTHLSHLITKSCSTISANREAARLLDKTLPNELRPSWSGPPEFHRGFSNAFGGWDWCPKSQFSMFWWYCKFLPHLSIFMWFRVGRSSYFNDICFVGHVISVVVISILIIYSLMLGWLSSLQIHFSVFQPSIFPHFSSNDSYFIVYLQ